MLTIVGLISSVMLQVVAAIGALWLLRASRVKGAWVMIFIAFMFMAFRGLVELLYFTNGEISHTLQIISSWLGIIVSAIMAVAVIMIGRILFTLKHTEVERGKLESRFTTLFHNSSDEIYLADLMGNLLEVNQVTCETLGFSRRELLQKNFKDLKTPKYFETVEPNLKKIIENGRHVYETEHVSKAGKVISLEVNSRVINYFGKEAIISIARDTTERKQMERNILSAVINAEEKERERISRDIHDGLGPLLSTVKLYVNELEEGDLEPDEKKEMLKQTNELINEAITSTKAISNNLSPHLIMDFGLVKAVGSFCKKVNLAQKTRIKFESGLGSDRFVKETEVEQFLKTTGIKPKLAITDSQMFGRIDKIIPKDIPLTGFSVLLARHKGPFDKYLEGTPKIDELKDGDRVLILESCTHQVNCDDIGRYKIPDWLRSHTGKKLEFDIVAGLDSFDHDLTKYALIVQCGGCMITRKQVQSRLQEAIEAGIPVTNYGMAIAWTKGIFERAVGTFQEC